MDLVTKQREERKQRILDVARRLIAEKGYDGVTMRELADLSLVSVPTLYNLFGGKNELLFASVESYFADLLRGTELADAGVGLDRILFLAKLLGRETPRHAQQARSLMGFFGNISDAGGIHELAANQLTGRLRRSLDEMQQARQLVAWAETAPLAERLASQLSITMFEWARQQLSDDGLLGAMLYGTSITLLGVARGKSATKLEALVREHQEGAAMRALSPAAPPGDEAAAK